MKKLYESLEIRFIFFFIISLFIVNQIIDKLINYHVISEFNLRSYQAYTVIINIIIGFMGIIGGYLYFKQKDRSDKLIAERSNKRQKVEFLISILEQYDKKVCQYMYTMFKSDVELDERKTLNFEIMKLNFMYTAMLENFSTEFGFNDEELSKIISIQSYVEKYILANFLVIGLNEHKILEDYADVYNEGLSQCIKKLK